MDFPTTDAAPRASPWRRFAWTGAALALAIYGAALARNVAAVAGGSDSSGYMNDARLLAAGHVHVQPRAVAGLPASSMPPFLYVPLGFKPAWNGDGMVPTYPTGFALLILALKPLAGWRHAGDVALILHAVAGVLATFALGRWLGLEPAWAWLGAAIVGFSPVYLFMALQAMSDVPSLAWCTLAMLLALKSRERAGWAAAAGAALAGAVLLRPTNILLLAPAALALGLSPRRWLLFIAGGVPGAVFFCAHSLEAYGHIMSTGYGPDEEAFHLAYVPMSLWQYGLWLPVLFSPFAVLVVALPWTMPRKAGAPALLAVWIAVYAVFYAAYKNTHEAWWYMRFLLPAAPAMAIGGLLVFRAALSRWPAVAASRTVLIAAAAIVAANAFVWTKDLGALNVGNEQLQYGKAAEWMQRNAPPDAVCVAMQESGALFYYTGLTFVRWDVLDKDNVGRLESALRASGRPLYAVLFPFEVGEAGVLSRRIPGRWNFVGKVDDVSIFRRDLGAERPKK
jgi:4-amino-4-deoxy-L-arabinose transferase-like glycosyltransferase